MLKTLIQKITILPILLLLFSGLYISSAHAAASFGISGTRTLTAGQTFSVTISANRNTTYNTVDLKVSASNLTILSATLTGGWTPISGPSRTTSSATFSGALLGQNITGTRNVLILSIKAPTTPGKATLTISGLISGDGSGTGTEKYDPVSTTYTINPAPTAAPAPKPVAGTVSITSSTHPDQNKWYSSTSPVLNWNTESGVNGFSYSFDNLPSTDPDTNSEGNMNTATFPNQSSGTFYFHIKAKNDIGWGQTSHFKINIDSNIPDPFTITALKTEDSNNYTIYFATSDSTAGIANYTVEVDGQSLGVKASNFNVPISTKEIKVIATDLAGNTKESILKINSLNQIPVTATGIPVIRQENLITNAKENSTNLWIIALAIISSLLLIFGITMTALYFKDKGHFGKLSKNPKISTQTKLELNPKNDLGIEESPLK